MTWFGDDHPAAPAPTQPQTPAPPPITIPTDPNLQPTAETTETLGQQWVDDRPAGHKETVVYLGINDASREKEKAAFAGNENATVITGSGTDKKMQGKVMSKDGKTVLDLSKEADLQTYFGETGVGGRRVGQDGKPIESEEDAAARMTGLTELFLGKKNDKGQREGGLNAGVRDEMAGFLNVLQGVEQGGQHMDRLVMSGHSTGDWVYSEAQDSPGVTFDQMKTLMGMFPKAQGGVKDLMLSACHTLEKSEYGDTRGGKQYQDIFPNLETTWGYNGVSPSWKQGSVNHISKWLSASDEGQDTSKLQQAVKQSGQNAALQTY